MHIIKKGHPTTIVHPAAKAVNHHLYRQLRLAGYTHQQAARAVAIGNQPTHAK